MNLISIDDLSPANINNILKLAFEVERCQFGVFKGKILATAFFEPSTRTKLSFQSAMIRLGGTFIDLPDNSSLKKGESEEDTIKILAHYADCIVIRHPKEVKALAKYSHVPVINAGDGGNEHPTQALLDLYTIVDNIKEQSIKLMFTGDLYHSRTINSLIKIISKHYPETEFIFTNEINPALKDCKHLLIKEEEIPNYIDSINVLYMTRPQVERHADKSIESNFILTNDLADRMKKDAIIMHPLPRTKELPKEIDTNPRAKYFTQVKNGIRIRMAFLYWLLY